MNDIVTVLPTKTNHCILLTLCLVEVGKGAYIPSQLRFPSFIHLIIYFHKYEVKRGNQRITLKTADMNPTVR